MSTHDDTSKDSKRSEGRNLACEAILRSRFGERKSSLGDKAMAQLRQESRPEPVARLWWWIAAAAVVIFAAVMGMLVFNRQKKNLPIVDHPMEKPDQPLEVARYASPKATGSYIVAGDQPVGRGARLMTFNKPAEVTLGDYCKVEVLPASTMTIAGEEKCESVVLEQGSVKCSINRDVGEFTVETDIATVWVTGTEFEVRILERQERVEALENEEGKVNMNKRRLLVNVLSGSVLLTGAMGAMELKAGERRVIPEGPIRTDKYVKKITLEEYKKAVAKIKAMVDNNTLSEKDAKAKIIALKKMVRYDSKGKKFTKKDYAAAVKKIKAMVEAGKLSEEDAKRKYVALRKMLSKQDDRNDRSERDDRTEKKDGNRRDYRVLREAPDRRAPVRVNRRNVREDEE